MNDIFTELQWRGLIHQTTADDKLPGWLNDSSRTVYAGFDPTADSLHVGSLLPLMMLRRFQKFGHRPIALVGGATGMIGDPSGKSAERNLLSPEALAANMTGIESQMRELLDFDAGKIGCSAGEQQRLDEGIFLHRVSSRRWQELPGQRHALARQREVEADQRSRFVVHGIQLHAATSV